MDDYDDIDRWQRGYRPVQNNQRPGPEALPPGSYDFQIVDAILTKVGDPEESIFRLVLAVVGGPHDGEVIERPTFFRRQESLDYLGGDMMSLGIRDADEWGQRDKLWSQELSEACHRIRGLRCHGFRKDGKPGKDGRPFPNLTITGLLKDSPMPRPPAPGAATALPRADNAFGQNDDSIPF